MNKFAKIRAFRSQLDAASRRYGATRAFTYARAYKLIRDDFSPKEILLWGLLDPALDDSALGRYVSKENFSRFQASKSPVGHAVLLEDKEVFYRYCESIELPIPETVAFLSTSSAWFPGGRPAGPGFALHDRLDQIDGSELIIKPCDGVYGIGVRALVLRNRRLLEEGREFDLRELMGQLVPGKRYVLQRRLANHPTLTELTGFRTLQALRVVTALPRTPANRGRTMTVSLRLSANDSVVNNFDYGRSGNIRAKIDVETGTIVRAVRASPSGFGMEDIDRIPRTGARLVGVEMPLWREMKDLLEVKAACFFPIRLVGWDVALTPDGPVVIEGNFWFDPAENAFGDVGSFVEAIENEQRHASP